MNDTEFLPQTIDALAEAQSRQTQYWLQMIGIEEEMTEARDAFHRLVTSLTLRYKDAAIGWSQAKRDAADASRQLDGMLS